MSSNKIYEFEPDKKLCQKNLQKERKFSEDREGEVMNE